MGYQEDMERDLIPMLDPALFGQTMVVDGVTTTGMFGPPQKVIGDIEGLYRETRTLCCFISEVSTPVSGGSITVNGERCTVGPVTEMSTLFKAEIYRYN